MIGSLRTRVRKQPIIALYFESEKELKLLSTRPSLFYYELCEYCGENELNSDRNPNLPNVNELHNGQALRMITLNYTHRGYMV